MPSAQKDALLRVLEASLQWHGCSDCRALQRSIAVALQDLFLAKVSVEVRSANQDRQDRSNEDECERQPALEYPHPSRCSIHSSPKSNVVFSIELVRLDRPFTKRDRSLLGEAAAHVATACEQLSRTDRLLALLNELEAERARSADRLELACLTPTERRIAELVGSGLSNAEIAEERGVSRRTVEKHLESVYAKLCLENRYQLIRELSHATA